MYCSFIAQSLRLYVFHPSTYSNVVFLHLSIHLYIINSSIHYIHLSIHPFKYSSPIHLWSIYSSILNLPIQSSAVHTSNHLSLRVLTSSYITDAGRNCQHSTSATSEQCWIRPIVRAGWVQPTTERCCIWPTTERYCIWPTTKCCCIWPTTKCCCIWPTTEHCCIWPITGQRSTQLVSSVRTSSSLCATCIHGSCSSLSRSSFWAVINTGTLSANWICHSQCCQCLTLLRFLKDDLWGFLPNSSMCACWF